MTKVLSERIEMLSPDKQAEVLKYIDYLAKKTNNRMTMDNRQNPKMANIRENEEQKANVHYIIW